MIRHRATVLASFAIVAIARAVTCAAEEPTPRAWEGVSVGPCKIAVPNGWRSLDGIRRTMPLYRQGDGIGVPAVDETDAPLQIGMTVEKFRPAKETIDEIANGLAERAKKVRRLELVGEETVEAVELSDGTAASLLTVEFIKDGSRRSLQMKLVAKDPNGNVWIASGQLVGGKESKWPTADSDLADWLKAHLTSFCLDPEKFDAEKIQAAYVKRDESNR